MHRTAIVTLKHRPDLQRALEDREEFEGVVRADRRTNRNDSDRASSSTAIASD